jgi:hypothetical protein
VQRLRVTFFPDTFYYSSRRAFIRGRACETGAAACTCTWALRCAVVSPRVCANVRTCAHMCVCVLSQIKPNAYPNLINTHMLANEAGILVAEQVIPDAHKDYDNLMTVELFSKGDSQPSRRLAVTCVAPAGCCVWGGGWGGGGGGGGWAALGFYDCAPRQAQRNNHVRLLPPHPVRGTLVRVCRLLAGAPRIVEMDGYPIDVNPDGEILFFKNSDRPGVLKVCSAPLYAPSRRAPFPFETDTCVASALARPAPPVASVGPPAPSCPPSSVRVPDHGVPRGLLAPLCC